MVILGIIPKTMPQIHSTAILEGNISLADDVVIGPHCVLRGEITIGAGTSIIGNAYLTGTLVMGERNTVYPFACIGFAAQDINYPVDQCEPGIVIGDDNTFRESVTVHRATLDLPTTIGNHNFLMTTAHVGHDCQIGNNVTLVTDSALGGHVHVHDKVIIGGASSVHQFVTIGKGGMLAGSVITTYDVLPYFLLTGYNIIGSVNIVGMRRSGMVSEEITRRKEIFKLIYRSDNSLNKAVEILKEQNDPIALEYVEAIESSRRGIVPRANARRNERRGISVEAET
jgi:UDP-N-acetylglucosamine acyltransferase